MDKKKYNKTPKVSKGNGEWRKVLLKLPWLLIIPITYGLTLLAGKNPDIVEKYYSSSAYPVISGAVRFLSSLVPWASIAEFILYIAIFLVLLFLVIRIVGLFSGRTSFARFLSFLLSLCLIAGCLFNLFYILWGFNYSRPSLYTLLDLPVEARPVSELESLCRKLASDAVREREKVEENDEGVFELSAGYSIYFDALPAAYDALSESIPFFKAKTYPAKGVKASAGMSYGGISGIYIPFTAEANVNVDQTALLLCSSAAHEMAHSIGIAREDEANFVGYLACMSSDVPAIRYSGLMLALINCTNKLYSTDEKLYYGVRELYSEGMVRDIKDYNAYWDAFEGPVEEAVDSINDNYLKFNQQQDGVKSYGMMVDLLLAYYSEG